MVKVLKFSVAALSAIAVGFLLVVVGVGTNGWIPGLGLKDTASESVSASERPIGQAAYALCIIATLAASAALVAIAIDVIMQLIDKVNEKLSPILLLVALIAAELGGTFGIIGSIIHAAWQASTKNSLAYALYYTSTSYSPGFSFYLTIIGSIVLIVGGGLARNAKKGGQVIGE